MMYGLDNREAACAKILLERISRAKEFNNIDMAIISYKDLSTEIYNRYGISVHYHTEIPYVIGNINYWCISEIDEDAPLMSVIVGSVRNNYAPGNGFWELYEDIIGKAVPPDKRDEEYIKELNYVLEYDWSNISEMVDKIAAAREI